MTDVIAHNVKKNLQVDVMPQSEDLEKRAQESKPRTNAQISVHGLTWGTGVFMSPFVYGRKSDPQPESNAFDTMIIADCLWMPSQHVNIVRTIDQNLKSKEVDGKACALVIAGYHTGRGTVARFFEIATGTMPNEILETIDKEEREEIRGVETVLKLAEIFEVDVDRNTRPWQNERREESKDTAKRWVVCAVLERQ